MTDDPRVNLGLLDPHRDPSRFDANVRSIVAGTLAERARLRLAAGALGTGDLGLFASLGALSRPALAAAAVIVVIAGLALATSAAPLAAAPPSFAESVGIPASFVAWAGSHHAPTTAELVDAFDAGARPNASSAAVRY